MNMTDSELNKLGDEFDKFADIKVEICLSILTNAQQGVTEALRIEIDRAAQEKTEPDPALTRNLSQAAGLLSNMQQEYLRVLCQRAFRKAA